MGSKLFFLIMIACCYPVLLVIAGVLANETKPKKNILIGVTLPKTAWDDLAVKRLCTLYRKALRNCILFFTVVLVPVFFIPSFSVMLTAWLCWLLAAIAAPYAVYIRAYQKLKALKKEKGWYGPATPKPAATATVAMALAKPFSRLLFLPALIVSLMPLFLADYHGGFDFAYGAILGVTAAGIVLLSILIYPLVFRRQADLLNDDDKINLALTNLRRHQWGLCWILLSWLTALFSLAMWFCRNSMALILVTVCLYSLAAIVLCVVTELRARKGQERLSAAAGDGQYLDEDEHWLYGLFYDNPNDRHFIINNRVGIGTTVNLARPGAKALMAVTFVIVAALPLVGIWCIFEEYTPITVTANETMVEVEHLGFGLTLDYDEVEDATLLYELPALSRVAGTSMETIEKGRYSVNGYGSCRICLDPGAAAFLVLRTKDDTYLISTPSKAETVQIYRWVETAIDQ